MTTETCSSQIRAIPAKGRVERRSPTGTPSLVPNELIDRSLRSAHAQLLAAREDLKAARRRVVGLEDAVESWRAFSTMADRFDPPSMS